MKASDVFQQRQLAFGSKLTFDEAFPEIKDFRAEVEWMSAHKERSSRAVYTKETCSGEYINCSNPLCYNGGFSLGRMLRNMVHCKQTHYEDSGQCQGYEGSPKGRRRYGPCFSFWNVKIDVEYKEPSI